MIANSCEATGKIVQPQKISVAPVTLTLCGFVKVLLSLLSVSQQVNVAPMTSIAAHFRVTPDTRAMVVPRLYTLIG